MTNTLAYYLAIYKLVANVIRVTSSSKVRRYDSGWDTLQHRHTVLQCLYGAATHSIMTISITTVTIMTLSLMTLSIMSLSIKILNITALRITKNSFSA
jgi:hypothetical protein